MNIYLLQKKSQKIEEGREEEEGEKNLKGREITRREWGKARVGKLGFGKLGETFQLWMGSKNNSTRLAHSLLSDCTHGASYSYFIFFFFFFAFTPQSPHASFTLHTPPYDDVARDRRSLHKMYTNFSYDFIPHSARHCV